jgi:hypothetical protein
MLIERVVAAYVAVVTERQQQTIETTDMNTPTIDEWIAAMDFTPRHDEGEFDHDIPNAHDDSAYTPKELEAAYEKTGKRRVCYECGDDNLVLSEEPGEEGWYRCAGHCALHKFH